MSQRILARRSSSLMLTVLRSCLIIRKIALGKTSSHLSKRIQLDLVDRVPSVSKDLRYMRVKIKTQTEEQSMISVLLLTIQRIRLSILIVIWKVWIASLFKERPLNLKELAMEMLHPRQIVGEEINRSEPLLMRMNLLETQFRVAI